MPPTIFITSAEGIGKSTLIPILKGMLPGCSIIDFDNLLRPYDGSDTWYGETLDVCMLVIDEQGERPVIVVGLVHPDSVIARQHRLGENYFVLLDCSEEERAMRLRSRGVEQDVVSDTDNLYRLRNHFRRGLANHFVVNTDELSPEMVAERIVDLLKAL